MANELIYSGNPTGDTGLTITGEVYDVTGTQVGSDVTMTEVGSLAFYRGDMPTAGAGKYYVRFFDTGTLKDEIIFIWDGSAEVTLQTVQSNLEIAIEDVAIIAR